AWSSRPVRWAASAAPVSARASFGLDASCARNAEAAFSPSPRWMASHPVRAGSDWETCGPAARSATRTQVHMPRAEQGGGPRNRPPARPRPADPLTNPCPGDQRWYRGRATRTSRFFMLARLTIAVLLAAAPLAARPQDPQQEEKHPKVPKDSILATIEGCLSG